MVERSKIAIAREIYYETLVKQALEEIMLKEADELLPNDALEGVVIPSARHIRRMKLLFARYRQITVIKKIVPVVRKSVAVILVVMGIVFSVLLSDPQVRAAITHYVIEIYEKFIHIQFTNENREVNSTELENSDSTWYISELPEGYQLTRDTRIGNIHRQIYEYEGVLIDLKVSSGTGSAVNSDVETRNFLSEVHNGVEYKYGQSVSESFENQVVWVNGEYKFVLVSMIPISALLEIAQNVVKK